MEEYDDRELLGFIGACALMMVPPVALVFAALIALAALMYATRT
jgi:hypothetical protein